STRRSVTSLPADFSASYNRTLCPCGTELSARPCMIRNGGASFRTYVSGAPRARAPPRRPPRPARAARDIDRHDRRLQGRALLLGLGIHAVEAGRSVPVEHAPHRARLIEFVGAFEQSR